VDCCGSFPFRMGTRMCVRFGPAWNKNWPGTKIGFSFPSLHGPERNRTSYHPDRCRLPVSTTRARNDAVEATAGWRGATAGRHEVTATLRPSPSSSFSPVIPSLSPSSSSSLPPLGFFDLGLRARWSPGSTMDDDDDDQ
jgi:hypothetical protein